jgi:hypothetical protein
LALIRTCSIVTPQDSNTLQQTLQDDNISDYIGAGGQKKSMYTDIITGAGGASSTVRKQFLPKVERRYVGYVMWRGTVQDNHVSPENTRFS